MTTTPDDGADAPAPLPWPAQQHAGERCWVRDHQRGHPIPAVLVMRRLGGVQVQPLVGDDRNRVVFVAEHALARTYGGALTRAGVPLTLGVADGMPTEARRAFREFIVDAVRSVPDRHALPPLLCEAVAEAWYALACGHPVVSEWRWSLRQLGTLLTEHERRWVHAAIWQTIPADTRRDVLEARITAFARAAQLDADASEALWITTIARADRDVPPPPAVG